MSYRRLIIIAMLVGWVLVSPIAIAHSGCVGMGMACDGPCVITPYALSPLAQLMTPQTVVYLQVAPSMAPSTPVVRVLTPPPKSLRSSASFSTVA